MFQIALILCAHALFQSASAQCIGAYNEFAVGDGFGRGGLGGSFAGPYGDGAWGIPFTGCGPAALAASNGRGLMITSASAIAPTGLFLTSENAYEGLLAVSGAAPFLGAVALEGLLPTIGVGAVSYGCGNGDVAIVREDVAPVLGGFAGSLGPYDGFAGPAFAGPLGYDGFAAGYGLPFGYDGIAPGYAGYGYGGCGGTLY